MYFNQETEKPNFVQSHVSLVKERRPPFTFRSGIVYDGEWKGDCREGYGVQIWPDGARYEGNWKDNKANGKGKFIHVDGDIYEG